MDLTHLDDVTPPVPDAAMRCQVVKTARRRRRVRVGLESATAMLVVAAILLAGVGSMRGAQRQVHVAITNPPSTTSTVASPTTTTVAPNTVTVQLVLDHTSVAQGQAATGAVVFTNTTGHDVVYTSKAGCLSMYAVAVGASRPDVGWYSECAVPQGPIDDQQRPRSGGFLDLAPGVTRVKFTAPATYLVCSAASSSTTNRCGPTGAMPPLPRGRSYVWFLVDPDSRHPVLPAPVPITIR